MSHLRKIKMKILLISQSKGRNLSLITLLVVTVMLVGRVISGQQVAATNEHQQARSQHQMNNRNSLGSKKIFGDILPGRTLQREDLAAFEQPQSSNSNSNRNNNNNQNNRFNSFSSGSPATPQMSASNANSNLNANSNSHHKASVAPPMVESTQTMSQLQADEPMLPVDGPQALVAASSLMQAPIRSVNPGDRVNIPCSLANSGGSIQFAKDDQAIVLDSGCAQCQLDISNDGQASLTINRVSHKDQGNWQCWSLDSQGKVRHKLPIIQLIVTNSPELPILIVNDRELLSAGNQPDTITVKENEIVSFRCVIRGAQTPVDYIHWMLDSSQNITHLSQLLISSEAAESSASSQSGSPGGNNYLVQSVLKLNTTKSMNLKSISCLSNHQLWLTPMTVTAFLNVLYEPSFTISREPGFGVAVSEGMTVILKCEIDSNPISAPIWVKDADNKTSSSTSSASSSAVAQPAAQAPAEPIVLDTQEDGSVVLGRTRQADSGWYRCKTENKYGNFSSFGYYLSVRPALTPDNNRQLSTANNAPATPPQLHHNQQQPMNHMNQAARFMSPNQSPRTANQASSSNMINNDQPIQSPYAPSLPHNVQPPAAQLAGNAQHPTMNNINAINAPIMDQPIAGANNNNNNRCPPSQRQHKIDGAPEIEKAQSSVQAILGRQLILTVRFCCNPKPTRIFWIHRHLAMIPGRMFGPYITREVYNTYSSASCYETTFEIEYVKPEDLGTVYVYISNERGLSAAQINIQLSRLSQDGQATFNSLGSQLRLGNANGMGASQHNGIGLGSSASAAGPSRVRLNGAANQNAFYYHLTGIVPLALLLCQLLALVTNQERPQRPKQTSPPEIMNSCANNNDNRNERDDDRPVTMATAVR